MYLSNILLTLYKFYYLMYSHFYPAISYCTFDQKLFQNNLLINFIGYSKVC